MARRISLLGRKTKEPTGLPEVPPDWMGSKPEYLIYWALNGLGMVGKFEYQVSTMGGRLSKGGAVLDFYIAHLNLAINITSIYYHSRTAPQRMADALQRAQLESMGITVIFITEEQALRDPVYYTREALKLIQR